MDRNRLRWVAGAVISLSCVTAGFAAGTVELVSQVAPSQVSGTGAGAGVGSGGTGPDFFAPRPGSLSADGRYLVFASSETNLVPGQRDGNLSTDVFLHDFLTGTTSLVSHVLGSPATAGDGKSDQAVISADGRWIVYISTASNLAPGQQAPPLNVNFKAILLYDRAADASTMIAQSGFVSFQSPAISADGRTVVFSSEARDLIPGMQGFAQLNVFLYDRVAKTFQLVDHAGSPITTGNQSAGAPLLSADGQIVAFRSTASDLAPGKPDDGQEAVFLFDRSTGAVSLAGSGSNAVLSADGRYLAFGGFQGLFLYDRILQTKVRLANANPADSTLVPPSLVITPDGRYVALISHPNILVPPQPGGASAQGVYLYDRVAGTFTLASRKRGSATTPSSSAATPALSADGRFVAFLSQDTDLLNGQTDGNGTWDVFLFDRNSGAVSLVSRAGASATTTADGFSYSPAITADGSRVIFYSRADDLAADVPDRNQGEDVFAFETATASLTTITRHAPDLPSIAPEGGSLPPAAVSGDGRWVVFESSSPRLIAGQTDTNQKPDVFLYDRATRVTVLVSHAAGAPARAAQGSSAHAALSTDGRWVLFRSDATDLVAGTRPAGEDRFYLFDRLAGTTVLVGRTADHGNDLLTASLTPDGRWVVFTSAADDVVPGPRPGRTAPRVYLWDRVTHAVIRVGHTTTANGDFDAFRPRISDDGRWIAFVSEATNLVPGQANGPIPNVFLWDRTADRTVLVSHVKGAPSTPGSADPDSDLALSADGRFLVFLNDFGQIEPGVSGGLYLYDRTSAGLVRIGPGFDPVISADGRYAAFRSTDVPNVDSRGQAQLFLYDRVAGTTTLVSRSTSGNRGGDDDVQTPVISADGRYLAFDSQATDLSPDQPVLGPFDFHYSNVFLWDRLAGTTAWISAPRPDAVQIGGSLSPALSASGRQVAFFSSADLVAGDLNAEYDAYLFSLDPPPPPTGGGGGPVTLPNCPLFDGAGLRSNVRRLVKAAGRCGVPATATQVVVRVTALQSTGMGNLRLYPGDVSDLAAGTLRFDRGQTASAIFTLPLASNGRGTIAVLPFVRGNGTVRVMVEVNGYVP